MKLPRQARAVIFDMDGLMFNTETLYRDAVVAAAAEAGHDLPLAFYLSTIGMSIEATRVAFSERYGKQFDFGGFWTAASTLHSEIVELRLCLKAGVVELLDFLDDTCLPRAIATSSRHEDVQRNLGAQGLRDRFQTVIARGDYSLGKPHPEPFLKAAERLGIEPELCVALEDSYNGVRAASGAGMMTIMVPDLLEATDGIKSLCSFVVPDLHVVRRLVLAAQ